MSPQELMQKIIDAAAVHGSESDPDQEVGDLQMVLRAVGNLLTPEQSISLATQAEVQAVLEAGDDA